MSSSEVPPRVSIVGTFPHRLALRSGLLRSRATSMCFLLRKTSWKREQQSKEKRMYRKGDGRRTRDNAKRENRGRRRVDALIVWYRGFGEGGGGSATWEEMIKRDVRSQRLLSFSSHCSPLSLLFTFPVPRSPFSELHAPNPTSDPHKGRRGRNTFGKSSSTPLQRIRRVSQKSLVPRYVCFSDSLGSGGAQEERETDSSTV